jgi:hypothetical protein
MIRYNPDELLLSVHIPKCGGTSLEVVLRELFGKQLYLHYTDDEGKALPKKAPHIGGNCVHGHFWHHQFPVSIGEYYPNCRQFITVLRDPFEIALSAWHYRVHHNFERLASVEDHLARMMQWKRFFYFDALPIAVHSPDVLQQLNDKFIWISTLSHLERSLPRLFLLLGRNPSVAFSLPKLNSSTRGVMHEYEFWHQRFREHFKAAYFLYDYVSTIHES